jgi:hypothetical protein
MSVHPTEWNNSVPSGRIFMEFEIWIFFGNLLRNSSFIKDKTDGHFTWGPKYIYVRHLARFFLRAKMLQTEFVEKSKSHILCSITFSSKSVPFMGQCGKMVDTDRPQMTLLIRRMHIACWMTRAVDTHSEYVILTALPRQRLSREYVSLLCLYIPRLYFLMWNAHEYIFHETSLSFVWYIRTCSFTGNCSDFVGHLYRLIDICMKLLYYFNTYFSGKILFHVFRRLISIYKN